MWTSKFVFRNRFLSQKEKLEFKKPRLLIRFNYLLNKEHAHTWTNRYRQRFQIDVDPLIDQLVDKAKLEESEKRIMEVQKQVSWTFFCLCVCVMCRRSPNHI